MAQREMIIDIPGLEGENEKLMLSVKVGDFLQFRKVPSTPPIAYGYSDSVVEAVEDSGEESDDELEDDDDAIVTSVAGSENGREDDVGEGTDEDVDEIGGDVVMTYDRVSEGELESGGVQKGSDAVHEAAEEKFVWSVPDSESDHERKVDVHAIGDEDETGEKTDVWTAPSGESDRDRNADENDQDRNSNENASENVPRVAEDADVRTVAASENDGGREAESNNEIAEIPDVDVDDEDGEISESTLFLVRGIDVCEGFITRFDLIELELAPPDGQVAHSYRILGETIVHSGTHSTTCACEYSTDFDKLEYKYCVAGYTIRVNPSGDDIRSILSSNYLGICTDCDDGFLDTLADLAELVDSSIYTSPALMDHQIVCPVCIGLPLLMEQQALRATLDHTSYVDLSAVVDWSGRLAPRRAQLGYPFHQFDEREWGFLFDDMLPSDHDDGDDGFEQLPAEMMDPNAGVPMQPASREAIAALSRMRFGLVVNPARAGEACLICQEDFEGECVVVEMPCGHVFHDGECVEQWLGTVSHRCPSCRAELPVAEAGEGGEVGEGEGEEDDDDDDEDEEDEEDEADEGEEEEDDDDDDEDDEDGGEGDEGEVEVQQVEEVTYSEC
ncbi:hypothetical protein LTR82_003738 [Friedmanniomyces endolithicus]|uniref:RING-type domain-containing protein n=1 Tax=Friedmanniomyces endolithicus TaxID=329885 RepID=A0AAN6FW85_9PEZI|nr:hypothetical protein LTR82_003738 [Friedmanniomyces endolithicus]